MKKLIIKRLNFAYNSTTILHNLTFRVKEGDFLSLMGPPGCGKSTLLSIIYALLPVEEGMLLNPFKSASILLHREALHFNRSVEENIRLFSRKEGGNIEDILVDFKLLECRRCRPLELPLLMRKRLELAGAFVAGGDLLILDEPFAGLKSGEREEMNITLKQALQRESRTVLMVTHSVREACYLSNRIILLSSRPARVVKGFSIDKSTTECGDYRLSPIELEIREEIKRGLTV